MKIIKLIAEKANNRQGVRIPTIAFLGDSVTQGCFELYKKTDSTLETFFDKNCSYHNYIAKIFTVLFPEAPINIINAGISGDSAPGGLKRLERDVLAYHPDLTVVCFGLNDCGGGLDGLKVYADSLRQILTKLKENDSEVILMTPNMMNTKISCHIINSGEREFYDTAEHTLKLQTDGVMDAYVDAAKRVADECGVVICDVYEKWKKLAENGVDTTELLANKINHPTREMNWLFAYELLQTILK